MTDITFYIIDNQSGQYLYERKGNIESLVYAIEINHEHYTLTRPPELSKNWLWCNNQWTTQPAQSV